MTQPDRRLIAAARTLRARAAQRATPGAAEDRELADLLERLAELAPFWHEPYAAPFVPIIQAGVRAAAAIAREDEAREEVRADG